MLGTGTRIASLLTLGKHPVTTGLSYYLAAAAALFLTRETSGIATIWPSSGILLAALLVAPKQKAKWHIAAAAVASFASNVGSGNSIQIATAFTVANVLESTLAAWLVMRFNKGRISFDNPSNLVCLCVAALISAGSGAAIATSVVPAPSTIFWASWFTTDLLGILIVTPLLMIIGRALSHGFMDEAGRSGLEIALVICVVALVTRFTFWQSSYPLLFLPMLAALVASFRLGLLGAAASLLIVAAAAPYATSLGTGPISLIKASAFTRCLFLQFYLLALFAASVPVAALLAMRTKLLEELAEKMRLLQLAESAASVGHWRLDTAAGTVTWSREVFRIHGLQGGVEPSLEDAIAAYHIDDRDAVAEQLEKAINSTDGFSFSARIVRPDGEVRHVFSSGEIDRNAGHDAPGLFGIIQDITEQVEQQTALAAACVRAEEAAVQATVLAETDQLTGLANRRRTSLVLEQVVQAFTEDSKAVSIVMFDIDHFKRINDTYGHHAGDEVLKRVALDATRELRHGDTLGRFGGEEFVIVLPNTTASTGMMVAERVRAAIEVGGANPQVTISLGVAELVMGETCESLLRRADQALYVAKREGRNVLRCAA